MPLGLALGEDPGLVLKKTNGIDTMNNRPLGPLVKGWTRAADPGGQHLVGQWADLRPMVGSDAPGLWAAFAGHDHVWDYLYEPPVESLAGMAALVARVGQDAARPAYVVRKRGDEAPLGYATYYTVVREHGCNEIGNVNFSPALQGTVVATDAFYLMIDWAFRAGFRRLEWKCNALNAPSRRAAQRLGLSFEGVFRQHVIVKGRNRDTAWFAMTDGDWQRLQPAFKTWLDQSNFDEAGRQRVALSTLTAPHLVNPDPTQA